MTRIGLLALAAIAAAAFIVWESGPSAPPAGAVPANDNLANNVLVTTPSPSGIVATVNTVGALIEGSEQTSLSGCSGTVAAPVTGATAWYSWRAPASPGTIVFDTFGSDYNTTLAVYTGNSFPLTLVACNDNQAATSGNSAALALSYAANQMYRIQLGGTAGATGNAVLSITSGAQIVVNHNGDTNTSDANLNLREAMLLATGGIGATGLNRALSAGEAQLVLNGPGGAAFADLVHFSAGHSISPASDYAVLGGAAPDHVSGVGPTPTINGSAMTACFFLTSSGHAISGLRFVGCPTAVDISGTNSRIGGTSSPLEKNVFQAGALAIRMHSGASSNNVVGNHFGTDAAGAACAGGADGIWIVGGANGNVVGGSTPAHRNVISCYVSGNGIRISGPSVFSNTVAGNYIGLNAAGTAGLGNNAGILIDNNASNNSIGGGTAGARNVISGNTAGVNISGSGTTGNIVRGNYIGTNAAGSAAVTNAFGVLISGGATNNIVGPSSDATSLPDERNVISGNSSGIEFNGSGTSGNIVRGNTIGLNATGAAALPNGSGVRILADATGNVIGAASGERQVISGNSDIGVYVNTSSNRIIGNYIGTSPSGSAAMGNNWGVLVSDVGGNTIGGTTSGERNVISGNSSDGVNIGFADSTGNAVYGNYIGTDATGTADLGNGVHGVAIHDGASNNFIGGSATGQRNVISGNNQSGVSLLGVTGPTSTNFVRGNYIGTNSAGTAAVGNGTGILVQDSTNNGIGGSAAGEGNVVSGNGSGIALSVNSSGNNVLGNRVGTTPSGLTALPNTDFGIRALSSPGNTIGGFGGGANIVAFNGGDGVQINDPDSVDNVVRANSIHGNGGLGINNVAGGNGELAAPAISGINGSGGVFGFACASCTVDLYSDNGSQGRFYHGSTFTDASGHFMGFISPLGSNVTATATSGNNSSEFSAPVAVSEQCDGVDNDGDTLIDEGNVNSDGDGQTNCVDGDDDNDTLLDGDDLCDLVAEDYDGFEDSDGCPEPDNDSDGICDPGQAASGCSGSDTGQMAWYAAGHNHAAPIFDCRNVSEDFDSFKDGDGCPEPDNDNDGFPDGQDTCPGTDNHAGPDGVLGSGEDQNHNGILNPGEDTIVVDGVLTVDDSVLTFEDYDNVLNTDGCHDSPGDDRDGDGYTDEVEALHLGTKADDPCGTDAWPSDFVGTGISANKFDIVDLGSFVAPVRHMNTSPNEPGFDKRWDLIPGTTFGKHINVQDLGATVTGARGFPPMFGGLRALNRTCVIAP
jgi:hypothetical protein